MMLVSGQPVWQKGTPQSMQRAPCVLHALFGKRLVDFEPVVDALARGRAACGSSRVYSMKPVTLPMGHLLPPLTADVFDARGLRLSDPLVFVREDFDEFRQHAVPVFQNPFAARAAGGFDVAARSCE